MTCGVVGPQVAGTEDAEAIKASVAALKKVVRQRTMVAWKEWRASMEDHCGASLRVRVRECGLRLPPRTLLTAGAACSIGSMS